MCFAADVLIDPSQTNPIEIKAGDVIFAKVLLRLPLTPPPGVQKKKAKKGWQAYLNKEVDNVFGKVAPFLKYSAEILKYRPTDGGAYIFTIAGTQAVPPGCYNLTLMGPGFYAVNHKAVSIGKNECKKKIIPKIISSKKGEIIFENINEPWRFELIVSDKISGVVLTVNGKRAIPSFVGLAKITKKNKNTQRILYFNITPAMTILKNNKKTTHIFYREIYKKPANYKIVAPQIINPILWDKYLINPLKGDIKNVLWEFGSGIWKKGTNVKHRWLVEKHPQVRAFIFNSYAVVSILEKKLLIKTPQESANCNMGLQKTKKNIFLKIYNLLF